MASPDRTERPSDAQLAALLRYSADVHDAAGSVNTASACRAAAVALEATPVTKVLDATDEHPAVYKEGHRLVAGKQHGAALTAQLREAERKLADEKREHLAVAEREVQLTNALHQTRTTAANVEDMMRRVLDEVRADNAILVERAESAERRLSGTVEVLSAIQHMTSPHSSGLAKRVSIMAREAIDAASGARPTPAQEEPA